MGGCVQLKVVPKEMVGCAAASTTVAEAGADSAGTAGTTGTTGTAGSAANCRTEAARQRNL